MIEHDNSFEELLENEKKLCYLLNTNRKAWAEIYLLLKIIETKKLWLSANNSFSGWLKSFAQKTKITESILWHNRQAGRFYENFITRTKQKNPKAQIPQLSEIQIASENLNLVEKIAGNNELIADKMITKLLHKETTQKELRAIWEAVKTEKIANGEKATNVNGYTKKNEANLVTKQEMIKEFQTISINDIALTITNKDWLPKELIAEKTDNDNQFKSREQEAKYFYITDFPIKRIDKVHRLNFVIAENYTIANYDKPIKLNLHTIMTITNDKNINQIIELLKITPIFTDYSWIIIPETLVENFDFIKNLPIEWGIINIEENTKIPKVTKIPTKSNADNIKDFKIQVLSTFITKK